MTVEGFAGRIGGWPGDTLCLVPFAVVGGGRKNTFGLEMTMTDQGVEPRQPTVLLVDDNAQNLELLEVYMEDLPEVCVVTATNGQEAIECIESQPIDLVLLDIMMPKMSGFEVCRRIKGDPKTRDIIVVMVTALNETSDIERAAECGTDDYLSKPIDREALAILVRNLLASKRGAGTDRL